MYCSVKNILNNPLVDRNKVLFPPLHIKLVLIKKFTKALDKGRGRLTYLCQAFPGLAVENLKAVIFNALQTGQFIKEPECEDSMDEVNWKSRSL